MKVSELFKIGFSGGKYEISLGLINDDYFAKIIYRPGKGKVIDKESEIDWCRFGIDVYGDAAVNYAPIKVSSIDDILAFRSFF